MPAPSANGREANTFWLEERIVRDLRDLREPGGKGREYERVVRLMRDPAAPHKHGPNLIKHIVLSSLSLLSSLLRIGNGFYVLFALHLCRHTNEVDTGAEKTPSKRGAAGLEPFMTVSTDVTRAQDLLNRAGVRIIQFDGGYAIGVWVDLDSAEIRAALATLRMDHLPLHYLDAPDVPMRYKARHVPGEPAPPHVLEAMARSTEPWKVRDRMAARWLPWPLEKAPAEAPHAIDPQTGIRPVREWGPACAKGFVRPAPSTRKKE